MLKLLSTILIFLSTLFFCFFGVQPFLAYQHNIETKTLIVEGWLPDSALEQVVDLFQTGKYERIITTGGPIPADYYFAEYETFANWCTQRLIGLGIKPAVIHTVPASYVASFRTLKSAETVKSWINKNLPEVHRLLILSQGTHTRRTYLIYRKVFGRDYTLGIMSLDHQPVKRNTWYRSHYGRQVVAKELFSYVVTLIYLTLLYPLSG